MFEQLLLDISYRGNIILSKFFENRENYSINFFFAIFWRNSISDPALTLILY